MLPDTAAPGTRGTAHSISDRLRGGRPGSDVDAERLLVGWLIVTLLREGDASGGLGLPLELFTDPACRSAYRAACGLDGRGERVDVGSVAEHVSRDVGLTQPLTFVGGLASDAVEGTATAAPLVRRLQEAAAWRDMRLAHDAIGQVLADPTGTPAQAVPWLVLLTARLAGHARTEALSALVRFADVEPEAVRWLWRGRIPLGKLTILEGDPDEGKSTLALDIAARVSTGLPMPFESERRPPAGVVFLSAEDDISDTLRPRLEAAGGDPGRVVGFRLDALPTIGAGGGLAIVEAAIREHQAALLVVDPLAAFLADHIETYRDHHVRRVLTPLAAVAASTGAAVLAIRHLTKTGGTNAKHRGGGSIAFTGAARAVLLAAADPEDSARKVLAPVKNNLSAPVQAVAYCLDAAGGSVRVRWIGETGHTASALLAAAGESEMPNKREEAADFLTRALGAGARRMKDLESEAAKVGIKAATLRRARERLGIKPTKDGREGSWWWALPEHDEQGAQDGQAGQVAHLGHLAGSREWFRVVAP